MPTRTLQDQGGPDREVFTAVSTKPSRPAMQWKKNSCHDRLYGILLMEEIPNNHRLDVYKTLQMVGSPIYYRNWCRIYSINCINLQNQLDEISTFKTADKTAEKTLQSTHTFEQKIDLQSNRLKLRACPSFKSRVLIVRRVMSCHLFWW